MHFVLYRINTTFSPAFGCKEALLITLDEEETVETTEHGVTIHIRPVWKWLLEDAFS